MPSKRQRQVEPVRRQEAVERVCQVVLRHEIACQELWVSKELVSRGELVDTMGGVVPFPSGDDYDLCHVALVDPSGAPWPHAAQWAFVPVGGGKIAFKATQFRERHDGEVRLVVVTPDAD